MSAPGRVAPNPLAGSPCRKCGADELYVELREEIVARPPLSWSLSGNQPKTSATSVPWPWAVCGACGSESKGKRS